MSIGIDWQVLLTAVVLVPVAYAATNVDNLFLMSTISVRATRRSLVTGFLIASTAVLIVVSLASLIGDVLPPVVLGYLGFVPISIGLYLLLFANLQEKPPLVRTTAWPAIAAVLFANSGDTVFAIGPLFAESGDGAQIGLAIGFALIAAMWLTLILGLSARIARSDRLSRVGQRLAPWMMILVGLDILSDSTTDVV